MDGLPVSVIICTRDRPAGLRRALDSVQKQDSSPAEIIIVDGSQLPIALPAVDKTPVTIIRDERRGEGAARQAGMLAARFPLVAWCDDDAEWTSNHLRLLGEQLRAAPGLALVVASPHAHGRPASRANRQGVHAPAGSDFRASDVLHRVDAAAEAGGFDPLLPRLAAGDLWARMLTLFEWRHLNLELTRHQLQPRRISADENAQVATRLSGLWRGREERRRRASARLRRRETQLVPFDADTWRDGRREMIFQTQMKGRVSFPVVAKALMREWQRMGITITLGPRREGRLPAEWDSIVQPLGRQDRLGLVYDATTGPAALNCEYAAYYFMWSATRIPPEEVAEINAAVSLLYVPCRENIKIARDNGIAAPIRLLHHGIDPARLPYLDRPRDGSEPFTIGTIASLSRRKGTDILLRAFHDEFAPREPVRLALCHTYHAYEGEIPNDPRIILTTAFYQDDALREFLRGLDVFALPSRGEAFGLTGIEAMATGLPLIATNWCGPTEYLDPRDSFPLGYCLTPVGQPGYVDDDCFGCWAEPDLGHLRELLRYTYEHWAELPEKGRHASARMHRDWTWARPASHVIEDFDLLAAGSSPVSS